jgi:DNA-directed RNA polymerase subunit RPC12/RpoP
MDKKCITCTAYFEAKTDRSVRCPRCQRIYNKNRRNELTKAKYQHKLTAPPLPDGYIYLGEWAESHGHTRSGAQNLMNRPHEFGAIKVRNPKGGVDVWAVPKNTAWPY